MKRSLLFVVTATALLTGFVLYRAGVRPATVQAAPAAEAPVPAAYRQGQQVHGSSFHCCLRGVD